MKTKTMKNIENRKSKIQDPGAFTLIELIVVISIIALLAAFTIPVAHSVIKYRNISQTKAEMAKLVSAIESYKSSLGFYPPSNPGYPTVNVGDAMFSPLFFELLGTTVNNAGTFSTLDGSASITSYDVTNACGVGGILNCSKGTGEDALQAKSFLSGLKPNQFTTSSNGNAAGTILLGAAGGPDQNYRPLGVSGVNPWRYRSPGVQNPNSYDLWIQLVISGKTNLICNWNSQPQVNQPFP